MITDFDSAFLSKIKAVWPNTQYANTQIAYYAAYDSAADPTAKLQFPLINIYRPSGYVLSPAQTIAARYEGVYVYDRENEKLYQARFVMASLTYQLDFYATTLESVAEITGDIIHMLSLSPILTVTQSSANNAVNYTESYEISYNTGPRDESDFSDGQRLYRHVLVYELKNVRLVNFKEVTEVKEIKAILNTEQNIIDFENNTISGWHKGEQQ